MANQSRWTIDLQCYSRCILHATTLSAVACMQLCVCVCLCVHARLRISCSVVYLCITLMIRQQVSDEVDVRDMRVGAWFEGKVKKVRREVPEGEQEEQIVYHVHIDG